MEKNMQGIRPRSRSNQELIKYCEMYLDLATDNIPIPKGMPLEWQTELLKRFTALSPIETHAHPQDGQLDLFK